MIPKEYRTITTDVEGDILLRGYWTGTDGNTVQNPSFARLYSPVEDPVKNWNTLRRAGRNPRLETATVLVPESLSALVVTMSSFVMPAPGASKSVFVSNASLAVPTQNILIVGAGEFQITGVSLGTGLWVIRSLGAIGGAAPGSTIPTNANVYLI